jgi:hypothetical protein
VLGPVVFLWLVLGYHQQGEELKHNTQALELQAAELRELVGHNARMVEVAKEQLEADLKTIQVEAARLAEAARPRFHFHPSGHSLSGEVRLSFSAVNVGAIAAGVRICATPRPWSAIPEEISKWDRGERIDFSLRIAASSLTTDPVEILIDYIDQRGIPGCVAFVAEAILDEATNRRFIQRPPSESTHD